MYIHYIFRADMKEYILYFLLFVLFYYPPIFFQLLESDKNDLIVDLLDNTIDRVQFCFF